MKTQKLATFYAILAAALYAINVPLSKALLDHISPTFLAALLYLGAGIGMLLFCLFEKIIGKETKREPLTKKELPYTVAMVVLDIAAPILLMLGIKMSHAANVSLMNNFEIVATSIIALVIFKEVISKRLWIAIGLVTLGSAVLTFEGAGSFDFNIGSLFVFAACLCWGFENNCTKMISNKSSVEIVIIKGIFSGLGSLIIALILGEKMPLLKWIFLAMLLGFFAYGLSIHFYIMAQNHLGAAKTSAFYSVAPFLGVAFSFILLGDAPALQFYLGLAIMIASTLLMIKDTIKLQHSHSHSHGDLIHTHLHTHENAEEEHIGESPTHQHDHRF